VRGNGGGLVIGFLSCCCVRAGILGRICNLTGVGLWMVVD
jgi:hypothetical protein